MAEGPAVAAAVVRGLEEYMDEMEAEAGVDAADQLTTFLREIYNQFFRNVLGVQLREPGEESRIEINVLRKQKKRVWSPQVTKVVHGYLKFCPVYDDLMSGLRYERAEALGSIHVKFVPLMLDEFIDWASSEGDGALLKALYDARRRYRTLVEEWERAWHHRDWDDEDEDE